MNAEAVQSSSDIIGIVESKLTELCAYTDNALQNGWVALVHGARVSGIADIAVGTIIIMLATFAAVKLVQYSKKFFYDDRGDMCVALSFCVIGWTIAFAVSLHFFHSGFCVALAPEAVVIRDVMRFVSK